MALVYTKAIDIIDVFLVWVPQICSTKFRVNNQFSSVVDEQEDRSGPQKVRPKFLYMLRLNRIHLTVVLGYAQLTLDNRIKAWKKRPILHYCCHYYTSC